MYLLFMPIYYPGMETNIVFVLFSLDHMNIYSILYIIYKYFPSYLYFWKMNWSDICGDAFSNKYGMANFWKIELFWYKCRVNSYKSY